jgi:PAS domain S-box-containing protein
MDHGANTSQENIRLRRTMRDLVALSTLPAIWTGLSTERIVESLADVVQNTLSLDFVYIRLAGITQEGAIETLRSRHPSGVNIEAVRSFLAPLLQADQAETRPAILTPFSDAMVQVAITRFGAGDDQGVLVAGCSRRDFPTDQDRVLLGVGANQTAIVIQRRRAEGQANEQREWLRVTLGSIGDAVIATDMASRITFMNSVAQKLTGWDSPDAEGQPLQKVFKILNEQTRQPVENPVERVLREGLVVGLANHTILVARDGTELPIDDSAAPIRDAAGKILGVVLIFREVSEQRRIEHQRNVRLSVTHALSTATTVDEGVGSVLRAVGENLRWDVGFLWRVNDEGTALVCAKAWQRPESPAEEFEMASCAHTLRSGEGLPGRVWESRAPVWIYDIDSDPNFPRLASAARNGFHSAFAQPIIVGDRTLGVIEFFTQGHRDADANLMELMGTVAGSLGQFIERKTAEHDLRQSEEELADFFENATIGLHWVGPDGTVLRVNQAELDLLGYTREEYIGHPIAEFHADEDVICDILKRLQAGQKLVEYPARLRCKDGSIREVLIDSSVLWRDGAFIHTRCFTRDVTERVRAEARAREEEKRNRTILESITDAFCAFDRDWRFTYVNRQAEVLLGRPREDLLGRNHWETFPDTVGTDLEGQYRRAMSENVPATFEFFYPAHDCWYELNAFPSVEGLSVYFRDVSMRKRAELATQEIARRFREFADAMPQIAWTAEPDGRIDYLNRRWTEFTGLSQTVGNEGWGAIMHPADAGPAGERWAASVASGKPFEMELRLRDRRLETYRWHLIRTIAVYDEAGKVARWFGTSTDIHEQKRSEESARYLAEASAALATIVDYESTLQKVANLAVPYFADWSAVDVVDGGSLRRLAVSHQDPEMIHLAHELFRYYPPDLQAEGGISTVIRTARPEIVHDITDEMLVQAAKDPRHLRLIRSLGLKSYICVPLIVSGATLGTLTFATAESRRRYTEADLHLATDLANRAAVAIENNQLYRALKEADRRKDEFLATLAHELRNPLAPVRNAVELLKQVGADTPVAREARSMMERQIAHMARLIDDLMDVSRITRAKLVLRREKVNMAAITGQVAEVCRKTYADRHHDIRVNAPAEPLYVHGDAVRLDQVIGNLLNNACKYTDPGGVIEVRAAQEGEEMVVIVRDNGIGIAREMLPKVFDMFTQAHHSNERAGGGLGIGLSLVKGLVELHGGSVTAHSDGEGRGSEFVVRLPAWVETLQSDETPAPSKTQSPRAGHGHRILVVDDNKDAARSLAMVLKLQGHDIRTAGDGEEAVQQAVEFDPEVVLLDIGLPKLDGYDVCRAIRKQRLGNQPLVIALTGWGQEDDRRRSRDAGFDSHVVKPVDCQELMRMIESFTPPSKGKATVNAAIP